MVGILTTYVIALVSEIAGKVLDRRNSADDSRAKQSQAAGRTRYPLCWNQEFEQVEDPCGGLISWSAEAVT